MSMPGKRVRTELLFQRKLEIINYVESLEKEGKKVISKEIAKKFNIKPSTLCEMIKLKNRQKVKDMCSKSRFSCNLKRSKHSNYEITSSALLEKFPLVVVGMFLKPRCFKNVRNLPVIYYANRTAWMTSKIFTEYLISLDKKMDKEGRKIALILDRCPAHPTNISLKNIELFFLPPNSTSRIQPLDAGIIKSMKRIYRNRLVMRMLTCVENGLSFEFNMLDSLWMLKQSWEEVSPQVIINCFYHVGFNVACSDIIVYNDMLDSNSIQQTNDAYEKLKECLNITTTFEEYLCIDSNLKICADVTIKDIAAVYSEVVSIEKNIEEDSKPELKPSNKEVLNSFNIKKRYLYIQNDVKKEHIDLFNKISLDFEKLLTSPKKQTTIDSFFSVE